MFLGCSLRTRLFFVSYWTTKMRGLWQTAEVIRDFRAVCQIAMRNS